MEKELRHRKAFKQDNGKLLSRTQAQIKGHWACVRGERVDLELSVGSWRQSTRSAGNSFPAIAEKSLVGVTRVRYPPKLNGPQLDERKQAYRVEV
jgi:hypothetical protein